MPDWRRLSLADKVAWVIGSGLAVASRPLRRGTVGSAVAVAIFAGVKLAEPSHFELSVLQKLPAWWMLPILPLMGLLVVVPAFAIGVWATGRMSTDRDPDPGAATWDEFVGMWITALPMAERVVKLFNPVAFGWLALAFVLFRAFDVWKPWPCRRLERLPGGWGIMLDDVAAGVWALVVGQIVFWAYAIVGLLLFY